MEASTSRLHRRSLRSLRRRASLGSLHSLRHASRDGVCVDGRSERSCEAQPVQHARRSVGGRRLRVVVPGGEACEGGGGAPGVALGVASEHDACARAARLRCRADSAASGAARALISLRQRVRDAAQLAAAERGLLHHCALHALLCAPKRTRTTRQRETRTRRPPAARARGVRAHPCRAGRSTWTPARRPCAGEAARAQTSARLLALANAKRLASAPAIPRCGRTSTVQGSRCTGAASCKAGRQWQRWREMSSAANGRVLRRARTIAAASNARSLSVVEALAMLAAQLRGCKALGRRCCSGAAERGGRC